MGFVAKVMASVAMFEASRVKIGTQRPGLGPLGPILADPGSRLRAGKHDLWLTGQVWGLWGKDWRLLGKDLGLRGQYMGLWRHDFGLLSHKILCSGANIGGCVAKSQ